MHVVLTGVGGKGAWREAAKVAGDGNVDVCISSGLAGALRQEYRPGDILAAKQVYAFHGKQAMASDPDLFRLAEEHGARGVGSFYSSDHVIGRASEKQALSQLADAVEMESAEVLCQAAALRAKGIAIRGISDAADEDLPLDFNRIVTSTGEVSIPRVLGEVVRHPWSTPALVRFGSQSRMAAERLAVFLDHYIGAVARSLPTIIGAAAR